MNNKRISLSNINQLRRQFLLDATSTDHFSALTHRNGLFSLCRQVHPENFPTDAEYRYYLRQRTTTLTLLAGSGTRWVNSIKQARSEGHQINFDLRKPRGLFPVKNLIPGVQQRTIPVAGYSLYAVRDLGRNVILILDHMVEIESEILRPLGITQANFQYQAIHSSEEKPLGHGEGTRSCMSAWRNAQYLITNFGGDPNANDTLWRGLAVLDTLNALGQETDLIVPVTRLNSPQYPIFLDDRGFPTRFGHNKLTTTIEDIKWGFSNIGIRIYRTTPLVGTLNEFYEHHYDARRGYTIEGNNGNEFALDNVDQKWALAGRGRVRILNVADPAEIANAKTFQAIPGYLKAMEQLMLRQHPSVLRALSFGLRHPRQFFSMHLS